MCYSSSFNFFHTFDLDHVVGDLVSCVFNDLILFWVFDMVELGLVHFPL
jgi:hypothetical protein